MYGDTTLSLLEVDIENNKIVQQNFFQYPTLPQTLTKSLIGVGRWSKNGIMFDESKWNPKIDWVNLRHKQFHGSYSKFGEAWGTAKPQTDASRLWLDSSYEGHKKGKLETGKLHMGYIYFNSAWSRDLGWTETSVDNLLKGSSVDEIANNLINYEPNIYLVCRMLKDGTGQTFTAAQLKKDPVAEVDGLVIDLEKYWLSNNALIGDFWISKTLSTCLKGLQFLADNGYLPKNIIDDMIIYSSEWFLREYGNVLTRDVVARHDSIPAGYYYDPVKKGYINCKTIDELIVVLEGMSGTWQPYNIGAGIPGKVVVAYQILANITMPQVENGSGGLSAIDVNSFNIPEAAIYARFPKYKVRRDLYETGTPPPPPPPPPPPVETISVGTVTRACTMRNSPVVDPSTAIMPCLIPVGTKVKIVDTITKPNGDVWHKAQILGDFYIADTVNKIDYLDVKDVPKP
jgi:hypothetical protein